jgi:alkylated DNA nucleotide flippase Atl1
MICGVSTPRPDRPEGLPTPYAERVLDLVERIPPGLALTYGDVAGLLDEAGPRQVGRVMALWGGGVPWWRVVRASGDPAAGHEAEALRRLRDEGAPLLAGGRRVDLRRGRWPGP